MFYNSVCVWTAEQITRTIWVENPRPNIHFAYLIIETSLSKRLSTILLSEGKAKINPVCRISPAEI